MFTNRAQSRCYTQGLTFHQSCHCNTTLLIAGLYFHVVGEGVVNLARKAENITDKENYIDFRLRLLGADQSKKSFFVPCISMCVRRSELVHRFTSVSHRLTGYFNERCFETLFVVNFR